MWTKNPLEPSGAESGLHWIPNLGLGHGGKAGHATRMGFISLYFWKGNFFKEVETNAPEKKRGNSLLLSSGQVESNPLAMMENPPVHYIPCSFPLVPVKFWLK